MEKITKFLISRFVITGFKKSTLFIMAFFLSQSTFSQNSILDLLNGEWNFKKNMGYMDINLKKTESKIKIRDSSYIGEVTFINPDQLLFKLSSNQSCPIIIKIRKIKVKEDVIIIKFRIYLYNKRHKITAIKINK